MMRAVLAELDEHESKCTYAGAVVHRAECGCGRDFCFGFTPSRSALVSARRALHRLAETGVVELSVVRDPWSRRRWLVAKRRTAA